MPNFAPLRRLTAAVSVALAASLADSGVSGRALAQPDKEESFHISADGEPTLFLLHRPPAAGRVAQASPALYIHGATFPSALSVAYEFDGYSWMDDLAAAGFSVWALDFAGVCSAS